jgi:hypothetical protein
LFVAHRRRRLDVPESEPAGHARSLQGVAYPVVDPPSLHFRSPNAAHVRELTTELIGRLGVFTGHIGKAGNALKQAAKALNQAIGSLESRLLVTARKSDRLGIAGELHGLEQVPTIPRLPAGTLTLRCLG